MFSIVLYSSEIRPRIDWKDTKRNKIVNFENNLKTLFFLLLLKDIDCGYSLEPPRRGGSNEYPESMFWAEIWKKSQSFYLKIFSFWRWNFLYIWIYVMDCSYNVAYSNSLFGSLGKSSDSSRKQKFRNILGKFSYFIMRVYVDYTHWTNLMNTLNIPLFYRRRKTSLNYFILPSDLALSLTLSDSNPQWLELQRCLSY